LFDYLKHIIFQRHDKFVVKKRGEDKNEGETIITYSTYEEVVIAYEKGELYANELKPAVASAINELLKPVREHFEKDAKAKGLLDKVKSFKVTK